MCSHVRLFWAFGRFWSFAAMSQSVRDETVTWHRTRPLDGSCALAVVLLPLVLWSPRRTSMYQNQIFHPRQHRKEKMSYPPSFADRHLPLLEEENQP